MDRGGTLWLPVRRTTPQGRQIDLVVPPIPCSAGLLDAFMEEVNDTNPRPLRILWIDENDARLLSSDRFSVRLKDTEYLYDPARVAAASGRPFRDLRKRLNGFRRRESALFRRLDPGDKDSCLQLLHHWRRRQGRKQRFLLDWGYTRAAVGRYDEWEREGLQGWCVEISGRVAGFAMAGTMGDDLANFFVLKTDPDVRGLSEYLRWEVCRALAHFPLVNDGGDLGLSGLRQHKRKLRPVGYLPVYSATARRAVGVGAGH